MKSRIVLLVSAVALCIPVVAVAQGKPATPGKAPAKNKQVQRGEYLVHIAHCHDCHTPFKMGANGPERDMARMLSGHPADLKLPPAPAKDPWGIVFSNTMTAITGPWGTSYSANLTPDPETGILRDFTEAQFIATMRTGKHQGQGRAILPPMPWENVGAMTDEDLKGLFAYLRQIPAVKNKVPEPMIAAPPAATPPAGGAPAGGTPPAPKK